MERMEYTYKKANRMLDVDRVDLEHEKMQIESNLSRNVRKIDSTLKRIDGMRSEKKLSTRFQNGRLECLYCFLYWKI